MAESDVIIASRPFFSAKEIASFERTILLNPQANEHDASNFFARYPAFLHMGQGGELRREVSLCGPGSAYRVDFFKRSFGGKYSNIIELKRPTYPVVIAKDGNHPRLSAVAGAAIQQALDYRDKIISSIDLRKALSLKGIKVLRPRLTIIFGKDDEEVDPDEIEV